MEVTARISKEWRRRMLFMFFMIFGIAAWFLSDGYIFWPAEAERHEAYTRIVEEQIASGDAEDEASTSVRLAWQRYARENDFRADVPDERTGAAIREQKVIGWTMMVIALGFGAWIAWNHRLSIRAEGDTVIGASGQRVRLDDIVEIDRKKWKNKGIAYAIYEENGKRRRLTLDDHKFKGTEAIILEAERRIKERGEGS